MAGLRGMVIEKETLKSNQIKLESAVVDQKSVIEQQTKDLKKIRDTLTKVEETNKK